MVGVTVAFESFEERPPRTAVVLVLLPAVVAISSTVPSPLAIGAAVVGTAILLGGVRTGRRSYITIGTVALFAAVLLAGVQELPVLQVTVGAAATVVAWDAGTNAVGVTRQLGSRARTRRLLVAHTLATTLVAAVVGAGAVAVYWFTLGGEPTVVIALLLLAAVLFAWLLDR